MYKEVLLKALLDKYPAKYPDIKALIDTLTSEQVEWLFLINSLR